MQRAVPGGDAAVPSAAFSVSVLRALGLGVRDLPDGRPDRRALQVYHPGHTESSAGVGKVQYVSSANVVRPVVLAASCLVIGFVGGWALANVGGDGVSLPAANIDVTVEQPAPKTSTVDTPPEATAPERDSLVVSVLNGTTRPGFAATTATSLKGLGYTTVTSGNTPTKDGPTTVYYREGLKAAADQLASDLQTTTVAPIEESPVATSADAATQLIVILGT